MRRDKAGHWSAEEKILFALLGPLESQEEREESLLLALLSYYLPPLPPGGALRSACWRSNVDLILINTARNSLEHGWATEIVEPNESSASWADFQLAALRALLASFLSSVHVRPPHLAQGLELFRRGNSHQKQAKSFSFHHQDQDQNLLNVSFTLLQQTTMMNKLVKAQRSTPTAMASSSI
ncbi:hypothetical protein CJ030_MR0G005903 [Morella rubra]|uniref:Uncharacterized protein n=1 Tax=Morella rubra TaxID=262757 RepID=A0A6A1UM96_9ROSI|nr:hypothetical protein CJ030_MR0G005903 [Morella rubra]